MDKIKFQSQNGLILIGEVTLYERGQPLFQSQNGLILICDFAWIFFMMTRFQSQNGLILIPNQKNYSMEGWHFNPKMVLF